MILVSLLLLLFFFCVDILPAAIASEKSPLLTKYHVSTHVRSRLAETTIDMVFQNTDKNCSKLHTMTLQLPLNSKVTELLMNLSNGCELSSQVRSLEAASTKFEIAASEGKPAALLTAWDMTNYKLQVSIPSNNGTANVQLKYQELLWQKLDRISFQVPLFPGIAVNRLLVDIEVEEPNTGIIDFSTESFQDSDGDGTVEIISESNTSSKAHYEQLQVLEDTTLPRLLQAYYLPGALPEAGLILSEGECFTHLFNPSSFLSTAGPMSRRIVFVIDVSGSMSGQKLRDAKSSFVSMIDTLDENDTLIVQIFSSQGTESLWGPEPATPENKERANAFVRDLSVIGGTNLNDAFLDGISNVIDSPSEVASILVILTDGRGNIGPQVTARNIREKNVGGKVKIFSLAFGFDADMDLLLGIAIQNGGRAVRIYEGFDDAVSQMELFYKQELGTIMLSDVDVKYDFGGVNVIDSTLNKFPVLALGSEVVVRGKLDSSFPSDAAIKAGVTANSAIGPREWSSDYIVIENNDIVGNCRQMFAQARVAELLEYRDAERSLGNDLLKTSFSRSSSTSSLMSFEDEARQIALDADLVWPGLTALVTIDNPLCQNDASEICYSGEGSDVSGEDDLESRDYERGSYDYDGSANVGSAFAKWSAMLFSYSLVGCLALALYLD